MRLNKFAIFFALSFLYCRQAHAIGIVSGALLAGGAIFGIGGISAIGAGIAASAAPILTAVSAGAGIFSAFNSMGQRPAMPQLQLPPPTPIFNSNVATQSIIRSPGTKTILTSPLGNPKDTSTSVIQKKQLVGKLGQ